MINRRELLAGVSALALTGTNSSALHNGYLPWGATTLVGGDDPGTPPPGPTPTTQAIAVDAIPAQTVATGFTVTGTVYNYLSPPTLQWADSADGPWTAVPAFSGTTFSFSVPSTTFTANGAGRIWVRDANNTAVMITSLAFPVASATAPPLPPVTIAGNLLVSRILDSSNDVRDATACWQKAGMVVKGGIPTTRTQHGSMLMPIGGGADDAARINSAIAACPANRYVLLGPGTFTLTGGNMIYLYKDNITLRGSGAGVTTITRNPPAIAGSAAQPSSLNGILLQRQRWSNGFGPGTNLTVDGASGATSIRVASARGFKVGDPILIDETTGGSWMPSQAWYRPDTPPTYPPWMTQWASDDYRVQWRCFNPFRQYLGDFGVGQTSENGSAAGWFCRLDRPTSEIKVITAISGNTITFDTPLMMTYRTSHTAQACPIVSSVFGMGRGISSGTNNGVVVQNTGIEDLTLTGCTNSAIDIAACMYCWVKNVELSNNFSTAIDIWMSTRIEVVGCYIHDAAWAQPGGAGYNFSLSWGSSEVLFHNSISLRANKVMVARCSGAGSVIAYNYCDVGYINNTLGWQEIGANASHMVGPHHVLFEGNWTFNLDQDNTHGNSIYLTSFRNQITCFRSDFTGQSGPNAAGGFWSDASQNGAPLRGAGGCAGTNWLSIIGNVIGTSGLTTAANGWVTIRDIPLGNWNTLAATKAIYGLGTEATSPYGQDKYVIETAIINGNYDFLNNAQQWDVGPAQNLGGPQTLPNSFYLTSAPPYFSGLTWPWVDPSMGTVHTLPAKARNDAGTPNAV